MPCQVPSSRRPLSTGTARCVLRLQAGTDERSLLDAATGCRACGTIGTVRALSAAPTGEGFVRVIVLIALAAAGFALSLWVFYPGVMTYDAGYVYDTLGAHGGVAQRPLGDWQS